MSDTGTDSSIATMEVAAGFRAVFVSLFVPLQCDYRKPIAYFEVFRSETPKFGDAVLWDKTRMGFLADEVGFNQKRYYWAKAVFWNGRKVLLSFKGLEAQTPLDPD